MHPIYSTVWVVLEKQQHPVKLHHSSAISLKCPSILSPQFSKYGQISWGAWSKYTHSHIKANLLRPSWSRHAGFLFGFLSARQWVVNTLFSLELSDHLHLQVSAVNIEHGVSCVSAMWLHVFHGMWVALKNRLERDAWIVIQTLNQNFTAV